MEKSVRCDKKELEVAEVKILTFSLGVTRMDRIRNEYIRVCIRHSQSQRDQTEMVWTSTDSEYIDRGMMRLELPVRKPRGRPKRRFMDGLKEDMKLVGVRGEDAENRVGWRWKIRYGDP